MEGIKYDQDKPDMSLVPLFICADGNLREFLKAIFEERFRDALEMFYACFEVDPYITALPSLVYGAGKYARVNWTGLTHERIRAALSRHCYKQFVLGEQYDEEGVEHMSAIAANLLFLCSGYLVREEEIEK